jgi:hypothetical protein
MSQLPLRSRDVYDSVRKGSSGDGPLADLTAGRYSFYCLMIPAERLFCNALPFLIASERVRTTESVHAARDAVGAGPVADGMFQVLLPPSP